MNLNIFKFVNNVLLSIFVLAVSGVQAAEYMSTDDLLGVDAEATRGFLDVDDQKELGNTVVGSDTLLEEEKDDFLQEDTPHSAAGIYTVALSRNVRELCILPEDLVAKVFDALESELINSGKFEILSLDRTVQGDLAGEVRRVVAQGIADRNAVNLGQVSGVKYIAVLTVTDFSVRRRNLSSSVRFANGALEFECGISLKFIDTSTHKVVAQVAAFAKQLAALPTRYNYVDEGIEIKQTVKARQSAAQGRWRWVGDADASGRRIITDDYAGEDAVRNLRTINGWNVRQEQGRGYQDDGYKQSQSMDISENASAEIVKADNKIKIKASGTIEEDAAYKEYYRLSQENFASKALTKLAGKLGKRITVELVKEFYPIKIIKIFKNGKLAINSGSENGLSKGQVLEVRSISRERDPDTGRMLAFEVPLGKVRIISINKESAVGKMISAADEAIKLGSVLYPVADEAIENEGSTLESQQDLPFEIHRKKTNNDW